jgi:hypothetical protein
MQAERHLAVVAALVADLMRLHRMAPFRQSDVNLQYVYNHK